MSALAAVGDGAPQFDPAAEVASILAADDARFIVNWRAMTDAERSAIGAPGFDRFRKLTPEVGKATLRAERGAAILNAAILAGLDAGDSRQDWNLPAAIGEAEWTTARLAPDCIVSGLLYADVGVLIAPGGTGKTTWMLMLAACVVLGLDFLGQRVERSGPVIILTSEDPREMLVARLRRIAESMALSPADIERLRQRIIISDVTGSGLRLTTVVADSVRPDDVVDSIAIAAADIKPALIVIDPAVSFGVGESRVNDAEQGLIEAARRLRRILNCGVLYVHHTGKQNARDGAVDQYAGRGGSAFADGARMVLVLQSLSEVEWKKKTGLPLSNGEQGLILARPKISYCPTQGPLYIRRTGYAFEQVTGIESAEYNPKADIAQLVQLVTFELGAGNQHSKRSIEALYAQAAMTRQQLRDALAGALASGKLVEKALPIEQRQGGRRSYLAPAEPVATAPNDDGAVGAQKIGNSGNNKDAPYCAVPTAPPYRENKDGAVERARPVPLIPFTAPNNNGAVGAVGAVPHCPRCDGEGCQWCAKDGPL